jgi:hypothetical protein
MPTWQDYKRRNPTPVQRTDQPPRVDLQRNNHSRVRRASRCWYAKIERRHISQALSCRVLGRQKKRPTMTTQGRFHINLFPTRPIDVGRVEHTTDARLFPPTLWFIFRGLIRRKASVDSPQLRSFIIIQRQSHLSMSQVHRQTVQESFAKVHSQRLAAFRVVRSRHAVMRIKRHLYVSWRIRVTKYQELQAMYLEWVEIWRFEIVLFELLCYQQINGPALKPFKQVRKSCKKLLKALESALPTIF